MVGLVNAAGAPESARLVSVNRGALRANEDEQRKIVPILGNEEAVHRLVQTLVKTTRLSGENPARSTPNSEQSDRFKQADLESTLGGDVGRYLDLTA